MSAAREAYRLAWHAEHFRAGLAWYAAYDAAYDYGITAPTARMLARDRVRGLPETAARTAALAAAS